MLSLHVIVTDVLVLVMGGVMPIAMNHVVIIVFKVVKEVVDRLVMEDALVTHTINIKL